MKAVFLSLIGLALFIHIAEGQERTKTLQRSKTLNQSISPTRTSTIKVSKENLEAVREQQRLTAAYNWLAPFKNYGNYYTVENIQNLKVLDLSTGSPVINGVSRTIYMSDDSLVHLTAFKNLERIVLPQWTATNGFKHIASMGSLKELYAGKTKFYNSTLDVISSLPLEKLILFETGVSDAGVSKIVTYFPALNILNLSETGITNSGLQPLKVLQLLKILLLKRTNIDDGAIPYLSQLTQLDVLDLEFSKISASGKEQLRQALPNLDVRP